MTNIKKVFVYILVVLILRSLTKCFGGGETTYYIDENGECDWGEEV